VASRPQPYLSQLARRDKINDQLAKPSMNFLIFISKILRINQSPGGRAKLLKDLISPTSNFATIFPAGSDQMQSSGGK
jgi:hypothetical protein